MTVVVGIIVGNIVNEQGRRPRPKESKARAQVLFVTNNVVFFFVVIVVGTAAAAALSRERRFRWIQDGTILRLGILESCCRLNDGKFGHWWCETTSNRASALKRKLRRVAVCFLCSSLLRCYV